MKDGERQLSGDAAAFRRVSDKRYRVRMEKHQLVADTIDRMTEAEGRRPLQKEVAHELRRSERWVREYWPTKSPEVLSVTRTRRVETERGLLDAVIGVVQTETILENPDTGEPFADGRTIKDEVERQMVESCRAKGMGTRATASELKMDRDRVRHLLKMNPPT